MDKNTTTIIFVLLVIVGILAIAVTIQLASTPAGAYLGPTAAAAKHCNDKSDNDGDGGVDWKSSPRTAEASSSGDLGEIIGNVLSFQTKPADPGCSSALDPSELNADISVQCDNGIDDDKDGLVDYRVIVTIPPGDPGCTGPTDRDERNCGDGVCSTAVEDCASCSVDCGSCDSCSETDGGFNPDLKGTTSGIQGGLFINVTDFCQSGTTILTEFYCSGTTIANSNFDCAANFNNCVDGACVPALR